jgi:hypothetical protein
MKNPAKLTGFVSAACTSAGWLGVAAGCAALVALSCQTQSDPQKSAAASSSGNAQQAAAPARTGLPQGHPEVPIAASEATARALAETLAEASAHRAAAADSAAAAAAATPWQASCQVHRKCAKESLVIPNCEPGVVAEEWGQLEYNADKHLGQMVVVEGPLALTPASPPRPNKCAPNECCHSLHMNLVLDGRPDAVALPGFTCHGDDSALCCDVPANGQVVNVRGKIQKAPASTGLKFQLANASFCIPVPPSKNAAAPVASAR